MISDDEMASFSPESSKELIPFDYTTVGVPIPKTLRITIFSAEEWESFVEEWATSLKEDYASVKRFTGAGDQGVDIAGFISDSGWTGGWDNFQCKQYDHPLMPSDIWVEIGKIVYYSYKNDYTQPRKYYFVSPKGVGTTLQKLLADPTKLKAELNKNWSKYCENEITSKFSIPLENDFLDWFNNFDFSIFSTKSMAELILEHSKTPYHTVRFGGGLPTRPESSSPPDTPSDFESKYIQQLFNAYGSHLKTRIKSASDLSSCTKPTLQNDYLRQRERFFHAESLRNFARDNVPDGTFEKLQEEIYNGVIETCENDYNDGLLRMRATITQAGTVSITSNPLKSVVQSQDRQGICHQLANDDKLIWITEGSEDDNHSV